MRVTIRTHLQVGVGCYVRNNSVRQIMEKVVFRKQAKLLDVPKKQSIGYVMFAQPPYDACLEYYGRMRMTTITAQESAMHVRS